MGSSDRLLAAVSWALPVVGLAAGLLTSSMTAGAVPSGLLTVLLGVFFTLQIARLLLAAAGLSNRRAGLLALAAGVLLWAAGSAVLNAAGAPEVTTFPAPGEWLFLAAFGGIAAHILLDRTDAGGTSLGGWLEATVVCGGATSLAGLLILTPASADFGRQGVPLLLALLYPMLDLILAVLVVGQLILGTREPSRAALSIVAGLVLLAIADSSIVINLSGGTYSYGLMLIMTWAAGFQLLVDGACRTRPAGGLVRRSPVTGWLAVVAGFVAVLVLAVDPEGAARSLVVVPAVVTLLAAGARLIVALREARGAAEAYRLSLTDDLTGLPNRRAVMARLAEVLADRGPVALILLDLDGFKEINDSLGHAAGDSMLQIIASRLAHGVPAGVMTARLGGDEFALLLAEDDRDVLLELAHRIRAVVAKPARIDGIELAVESSAGVAVRDGETRCGDLLRRADVAMYQAKSGRAGAMLYDGRRDEFSRERLRIAEDLRKGIAAGQLQVWYQPQVDARTGSVRAVEALIRWQHPVDGLIEPARFLPAARRAGLMPALTEVMMAGVVEDAARWCRQGLRMSVAMNIAPPELLGGTVMNSLLARVQGAGLPPDHITVEVTEDSFLTEPERAREIITQLRRHRIEVSIDDYGTGFSSLSYLRDLPVQELKIDRSFVRHIVSDPRSWKIVASTVQLAQGLGLRTVAEGVENSEMAAELVAMGVVTMQGYLFARPMPAHQVAGWVRAHDLTVSPRA